jgi:hypothetical protein
MSIVGHGAGACQAGSCISQPRREMMLDVGKAFPEWLEPMAATLTQERFSGPEWIFER